MLLKIGIALIALGAIAGIATAIFWDGPDHDRSVEYRVINDGDASSGEPQIVLVDDEGWGRRGGFFPFVPLLVVGGVLVTIALVTRGHNGWNGPHGPRGRFDDWHREAHRESTPPEPNNS